MSVRDYYKYEIVQYKDSTNVMVKLEDGTVIPVKLIGQTELYIFFDTKGAKYFEFESDYSKVREYSRIIFESLPKFCKKYKLLEQQISELIANAVKHGNKCNIEKKVKVWIDFIKGNKKYNLPHKMRMIVEDEGEGFQELQDWNKFMINRTICLTIGDFEHLNDLLIWHGKDYTDLNGGNALFAAVEYWNGGMYFNQKANKCVVIKYFLNGDTE